MSRQGVYFVTRLKTNADLIEIEDRPLPQRKGLVCDQIICITQQAAASDTPPMMGRIELFDDERQRTLVFLTNNMNWPPSPLPGSTGIAGRSRSS
jgi:hypothetical protein